MLDAHIQADHSCTAFDSTKYKSLENNQGFLMPRSRPDEIKADRQDRRASTYSVLQQATTDYHSHRYGLYLIKMLKRGCLPSATAV